MVDWPLPGSIAIMGDSHHTVSLVFFLVLPRKIIRKDIRSWEIPPLSSRKVF